MAETAGNGESVELCDRQRTGAVYGRYACGRDGGAGCGGGGYGGGWGCAVSEDWGLKEVCGVAKIGKESIGQKVDSHITTRTVQNILMMRLKRLE